MFPETKSRSWQTSWLRDCSSIQHLNQNLMAIVSPQKTMVHIPGFANFIDEWSQGEFSFTNFGVILEYLESSITTKKKQFY